MPLIRYQMINIQNVHNFSCLSGLESRMVALCGVVCVLGTNIIAKESTMARPHNANQIVFALSVLTGIRCGVRER